MNTTHIVDTESVDIPTTVGEQVHAWELDEDNTEAVVEMRRPWGEVWRHASVLVLGGVLVAMFALAVYVIHRHSDNQVKAVPPIVTSSAVVLPPQPTKEAMVVSAAPTRARADDALFLSRVRAERFPRMVGDDDAIVAGHIVCNSLAGSSIDDQSAAVHRAFGWTLDQSLDFVWDAVTAYCPQNAR